MDPQASAADVRDVDKTVGSLVSSAQHAFQIFEPWAQASTSITDDLFHDTLLQIKSQSGVYFQALDMSITTSDHGITLAEDAMELCKQISKGDAPEDQIALYAEDLGRLATTGRIQADETHAMFRSVRKEIFQLQSHFPALVQHMGLQAEYIARKADRRRSMSAGLGFVQEGLTSPAAATTAATIISLVGSAVPGLSIILPAVLPILSLIAGDASARLRAKAEVRETSRLAYEEAVAKLKDVSDGLAQVATEVGLFTTWWRTLENRFRKLGDRAKSIGNQRGGDFVINLTKDEWAGISEANRRYQDSIMRLQDFYPSLAFGTNLDRKQIRGIQPQDDFPAILRHVVETTSGYRKGFDQLQAAAARIRRHDKKRLNLEIEKIRKCFHQECDSVYSVVRCLVSDSDGAGHCVLSTDMDTIRAQLAVMLWQALSTRAVFDAHKDSILTLLGGKKERRIREFLHHIAHRDSKKHDTPEVDPHMDGDSILDSLGEAIDQHDLAVHKLAAFLHYILLGIVKSFDLREEILTRASDQLLVSCDRLKIFACDES